MSGQRALDREAENTSAPSIASASERAFGLHRVGRFPLVHALGAALVDHALGVAERDVLGAPIALTSSTQAIAAAPGAVADELGGLEIAAGQMQRVDQAGDRDDGGAVLVVMEHRNVHDLAQALLDDETVGRLDVLEIDAAEARPQKPHAVDELVDILGVDLRSMESTSAKRLNSTALPSITGLEASAPRLPRPRMAVPLEMTATMLPLACSRRRARGPRRWP
jgi:hypothetical protein